MMCYVSCSATTSTDALVRLWVSFYWESNRIQKNWLLVEYNENCILQNYSCAGLPCGGAVINPPTRCAVRAVRGPCLPLWESFSLFSFISNFRMCKILSHRHWEDSACKVCLSDLLREVTNPVFLVKWPSLSSPNLHALWIHMPLAQFTLNQSETLTHT